MQANSRTVVVFVIPLLLLGVTLRCDAQNCADIQKSLQVLDQQKQMQSGCPAIPKPSRPQQMSEIGAPSPPTSCVPDKQAISVFMKAHQAEYDALDAQLRAHGCMPSCSPIPAAGTLKQCRPGLRGGPPICLNLTDADGDGIPDSLETQLIERFSPYLRFSVPPSGYRDNGADPYRPMDPITYIRHANLVRHNHSDQVYITNAALSQYPSLVLSTTAYGGAVSNLLAQYEQNSCILGSVGPQEYAIEGLSDGSEHGSDWNTVMTNANVGMFAHVSRFIPGSPSDLPSLTPVRRLKNGTNVPVIPLSRYEDPSYPHNCNMPTETCYRIEYYQFFGLNDDFQAGIGNHQADLSVLTVVYSVSADKLVAVSHWAHGYEMRFDLLAGGGYPNCPQDTDQTIGLEITCSGANSKETSFNILRLGGVPIHAEQDQPEKAQNNMISFVTGPGGTEFAHPVVFVEAGSHEFWPTPHWGAVGAPAHWGDDLNHHYLAHNIPNLGEIEHPMSSTAAILIGYSGYWGNKNESNDVSPGMPLHASWYWYVPNRLPIEPYLAER